MAEDGKESSVTDDDAIRRKPMHEIAKDRPDTSGETKERSGEPTSMAEAWGTFLTGKAELAGSLKEAFEKNSGGMDIKEIEAAIHELYRTGLVGQEGEPRGPNAYDRAKAEYHADAIQEMKSAGLIGQGKSGEPNAYDAARAEHRADMDQRAAAVGGLNPVAGLESIANPTTSSTTTPGAGSTGGDGTPTSS